jgi:hypothetical protein
LGRVDWIIVDSSRGLVRKMLHGQAVLLKSPRSQFCHLRGKI